MATTDGGAREYERPADYTGTTSAASLARAVVVAPRPNTYDPGPAGHLKRVLAEGET